MTSHTCVLIGENCILAYNMKQPGMMLAAWYIRAGKLPGDQARLKPWLGR